MKSFFQRYATPFITGLFLVSLISGIALFFHFGPGSFHGMHEWLSMVLILPFALHLWKNWRSFINYFRRAPMAIALAISLAAALYYFLPSAPSEGRRAGGPPQFAFTSVILRNSLTEVAPLLQTPTEDLIAGLKANGFSAATPELPLTEIASRSGKSEGELVQSLLPR
ncbi:hypothetical protein AS026_33635 [Rhizobium altiplani]|uniref:DUF4405 domain-containing protein n=1 Tax=Rhizobium altiplani TaxID=1864509 RepID=A0A120FP72_9HYPH|nr:hypothetical protein AS026_33635 [Rhizobium altiplani]